jgi:hypothetical protein
VRTATSPCGPRQRNRGSRGELPRQAGAVGVVDVDGSGLERGREQHPLGLEIGLHVGVEVEVVLGQVGEHADGEPDSGGALEGERVRGDLHRAGQIPCVEHAPKGGLEVDRLRGRALDLLLPPPDHPLHRSQQPRLDPLRLEHVPDQERGRGLPVGAGDAGHPQGRRRVAPEASRDRRHRRPGVGENRLRDANVEGPLDDQCGGPACHRRLGEVVAIRVLPPNAEEQVARLDPATVVGEPGDLGPPIPGDLGDGAGEQVAELHRGRF